ncbi:MAG: hypothetical protein AAGH76_03315 [Pseudomonadota bacterium]
MNDQAPAVIDRRRLFASLGGIAASGLASARLSADEQAEPVELYVPTNMQRALPAAALEKERATFATLAPNNLDDPANVRLARLKTIYSLVGDYAYTTVIARHSMVPLRGTAFELVNEIEFNVAFLTTSIPNGHDKPRVDDKGNPLSLYLNATFNRIFLDPRTLEPVQTVTLPTSGKTLRLPDTQFAFGMPLDISPGQEKDSALQESMPRYQLGEHVEFVSITVPPSTPNAPRVDTSVWSTEITKLLDPTTHQLAARFSYTASADASLFRWSQFAAGDGMRIVTAKSGFKTNNSQDIPTIATQTILNRYPELLLT